MTTQFTTRPWQIHQKWSGYHGIEITGSGGQPVICTLGINRHNHIFGEANATLIAAAPCLLYALERLVYDCSHLHNPMVIEKIKAETLPRAQAAIAKAAYQPKEP